MGVAGAVTTALVIAAVGIAGWLLERIRERRHERLDRLEQRRVWRQDWAVDADHPIELATTRSRRRDHLEVA